QLDDDARFLSALERNLDCAEQAKQRNERMAAEARRRLVKTILCGLGMAALILILVFNCAVLSIYTIAYTVILSLLSMLTLMVVSIVLQ
ncbi:MAG: hypothetical protein ACI4UJ_09440, partial [Candidatus Cryptobacteroides sp.]